MAQVDPLVLIDDLLGLIPEGGIVVGIRGLLKFADDSDDEFGGGRAREGQRGDLLGLHFLAQQQSDDAVRKLERLAGAGGSADGQVGVGGRGAHG